MPDISKCTSEICNWRKMCYRFTSEPSEFRQAYANFTPRDDRNGCDSFMSNKEYTKFERNVRETNRK